MRYFEKKKKNNYSINKIEIASKYTIQDIFPIQDFNYFLIIRQYFKYK